MLFISQWVFIFAKKLLLFQQPKTIFFVSLWRFCCIFLGTLVKTHSQRTEKLKKTLKQQNISGYFLAFLLHIHKYSVLEFPATSKLIKRVCERNVLSHRNKRDMNQRGKERWVEPNLMFFHFSFFVPAFLQLLLLMSCCPNCLLFQSNYHFRPSSHIK